MTSSITYWNRLEPSPRSLDLVPSLAGGVADGLWSLTRQWQLGEFQGADAASPAWIEVDMSTRRLVTWRKDGIVKPFDYRVPLEVVIGEGLPLDLVTSVDLGQMFESMLTDNQLASLVPAFRAAYPIAAVTAADEASGDDEMLRFRSVMAGRALDGGALLRAAELSTSVPALSAPDAALVLPLLQRYVKLARDLAGETPDSPAWNPERLDYSFEVSTGTPAYYSVSPGNDGLVSWEAFSWHDLPAAEATALRNRITMLPAKARVRAVPDGRWWTFDRASMDVGAIDVERRDLGKIILMDILLAAGSDWYVVPVEQEIGAATHLDAVCVRDVFGLLISVPSATSDDLPWATFTIRNAALLGSLRPNSGGPFLYGPAREEVRFVRDDMLTMAWAIEETIEGALGQPLNGYDRAARREAEPVLTTPVQGGEALPHYRLSGAFPEYRIPFIQSGTGLFERAAASNALATPQQISEEELRRSGLRVTRTAAHCRGIDGRTYVRIVRRTDISPRRDTPAPFFDLLIDGDTTFVPQPISPGEPRGSVSLVQGNLGVRGNFEVVVPWSAGGLASYWRDDDGSNEWHGPLLFDSDAVDAASLILSSFGNLEIVARIADRLAHFWRDPASLAWNGPLFFATGASGRPSFIQGRIGSPGNFELVTPLATGGMAHFWRNNATFEWSDATPFGANEGQVADVSLITSSFGNLELVARIGDRIAHFWRDPGSQVWNGPAFFASGISGALSFIQGRFGAPGNFEVVAPLAAGGLAHFWRNNADPLVPWSDAQPFGSGTIAAVSLIESNYDNLEIVALDGASLVHYWRDPDLTTWHGPLQIAP